MVVNTIENISERTRAHSYKILLHALVHDGITDAEKIDNHLREVLRFGTAVDFHVWQTVTRSSERHFYDNVVDILHGAAQRLL
jgi:hypothetical protein